VEHGSLNTRVDAAAFNTDGSRIATVSGDHVARVWSASSGREILALKGHAAIVRFIAFSPDSRFITTASEDGAVKLWRAELGREYNKTGSVIEGLDFSPDGKRLAVAHDEHIATVWDVESGRHILSLEGHLHRVGRVAFSADGKRIVTSSYDKTVRVWDAATGQSQLTLRGHSNLIYGVAISPDGRYVASCGDRIRVWNISTGGEPRVLRGDGEFYIMSLAFSPDAKQLATGGGDGRVILWNHKTGERQRILDEHTERIWSVVYRADGQMLATAGFDRMIHLWDPNSGKLLRTLRGHFNVYSANFSPDGKRLVATTGEHFHNFGQGSAQVWDVETGRELMVLEGHTGTLGFAAFSPDGQRIATADWNGLVRVWESFPWREQDYPGASDSPITQRAGLYAREYWKQRLAVDVVDSRPGNRALFTGTPRLDRSEFPARATNAPANLLDLTEHYNGLLDVSWFPVRYLHLLASDLSSLPGGIVSFAGIPFDVRGVIQLRAPSNRWLETGVPNLRQLPERVEGIRVGEKFKRLHAMLGAVGKEPDSTPIGAFILHYSDGRQEELPIHYGLHVRDWWSGADANEAIRDGSLAWRGTNHLTRALGGEIRVFASRFQNPRPEVPVDQIDFVSKLTSSGPLLIAVTIEQ
jgi:WD40 repeat protein